MQTNEAYYLSEWEMFLARPERKRASLAAISGRPVSKVLDVGCGAGQELLPFVTELGVRGTGVDVSPEAVQIASQQYARLGYSKQTDFLCCPAESLPFEANCFDVVICRLALPYTRNQLALSEMARVLRPGGLLVLRIHHWRGYVRKFLNELARGHVVSALCNARVLVAGTVFHVTGRQPDNWILKREVFQTRSILRRVLSSVHLIIIKELEIGGPSPQSPTFLIEKSKDSNGVG